MLALVLILALAFSTNDAFAGGPKVGTAAASELLIPMGARNVAMGNSNIANTTGTEAIYWNPAGLSIMNKAEVDFTYMTYFADMNISYFAAGFKSGNMGTFGVSFQSLDIGEIPVTTITVPEGTGEILTPNFITINVTYSNRLTDRISFGANTKLISESVGSMSASAFAWDLGLQYRSDYNIDFGIVLKNIGTKMKFTGTGTEFDATIPYANPNATTRKTSLDMVENELPTSLNMGLAYRYQIAEDQMLNVAGIYVDNGYAINEMNFGLEYGFRDLLFLRGGYNMPMYPEDYPEDDEYQFGFTFGAGLQVNVGGNDVVFDYAFRNMELFDPINYFTVGLRF